MNPKLLSAPVGRGRDAESRLEVVNDLLCFALGGKYVAENTVALANLVFFAFVREELDRAETSFFCGVKLIVVAQQPSELDQAIRLRPWVIEPFIDLQCFFRLGYPFLVEAQQPVRVG